MFEEQLGTFVNKRLYSSQENFPFREVMLYGAGGRGRSVAKFFARRGIRVLRFFDSNRALHGKLVEGVPCLPPADVPLYPDTPLLVTSYKAMDIGVTLLQMGVSGFYHDFHVSARFFEPDLLETHGERIARVHDALADEASRRAYLSVIKSTVTGEDGFLEPSGYYRYHHPATLPVPGDTIVDGGAYDGTTAREFASMCGGRCRIFSFEPFPESYRLLEASLRDQELAKIVTPACKGLWSGEGELRFDTGYDTAEAFRMDQAGDTCVEVVSLDGCLPPDTRVDMIKLDVEGSELEALKGGVGVLRRWRPKLQICLYHKLEDLWTIPEYLLSLDLGYTFYLGHSNTVMLDTVLYAAVRPEHANADPAAS